jgi:hypothetical protein
MTWLPEFSWYNIPKRVKIYQITQNIPMPYYITNDIKITTIFSPRTCKIYPSLDINIPSGNPGTCCVFVHCPRSETFSILVLAENVSAMFLF